MFDPPSTDSPQDNGRSIGKAAFVLDESLPLLERVADRMSDAMVSIFEALEICESERAAPRDGERLGALIRLSYDQVNEILKTISD